MVVIKSPLSLLFVFIIWCISAQKCVPYCSSCTNASECNADSSCFYLVDIQLCVSKITCDDELSDFWHPELGDIWIKINIPIDTETVVFTTCFNETTFDTILELYDVNTSNLIGSDDDGCGLLEGQSELIINQLNTGTYHLKLISKIGVGIEGTWKLKIICDIATTTTNIPTTNPTETPTINPTKTPFFMTTVPKECVDRCDAFSVLLNNIEKYDDIICLQYVVNRLFYDGACYKSVKQITLGLCDEDGIDGKCNNNNLHELIESIYSRDLWYIRAFGSSSGIRIDFGYKIYGEISFELCLKNVFKDNIYSNVVAFKKGRRKRYFCKETYLFGLPCINDTRFIGNNDEKERRYRDYGYGYHRYHGMSGNEEGDTTKIIQTSSPKYWTLFKGIFIVLGSVLVIMLVIFGIWWILKVIQNNNMLIYDVVENVDGNKEGVRTDNIHCDVEILESGQCINNDFVH